MTPDGQFTTLVSFTGPNGAEPNSLIHGQDGNLYGTTCAGGVADQGTVFRIASDGTLTTLHAFNGSEGSAPGLLIQESNGNLHGITTTYSTFPPQWMLFEMTSSGTMTVLARINMDGSEPNCLIQGSDGDFYATSPDGEAYGTVLKITPTGVSTNIVTFNGTNGASPRQIIQARDTNFYVRAWFKHATATFTELITTPG